jgi:hypothetical protein
MGGDHHHAAQGVELIEALAEFGFPGEVFLRGRGNQQYCQEGTGEQEPG